MTDAPIYKPWFKPAEPLPTSSNIAIIGGGISGVLTAYHLKELGFNVSLFEENSSLMSEASGNPVAILDPFISLGNSIEKEFFLQAYSYAVNFYKRLGPEVFEQCGIIKKATKEQEQLRFKKISKSYPENILYLDGYNLIFPDSGFLRPHQIAHKLSSKFNIHLDKKVDHISQEKNGSWSIFTSDNKSIVQANAVILCNAYSVQKFEQARHIELHKISGQISFLKSEYKGNNILCSEGYITPPVNIECGTVNVCGATFDQEFSNKCTEQSHKEILEKLPFQFKAPSFIGGRRNIRAMSPDHLPLSGPVAKLDAYLSAYSSLHHGPSHMHFPDAPYHKNLFVNVGLGARGFLTAPLLAKLLGDQLKGKNNHASEKIQHALHPARFIIRKLSKK